MSRETAAEKSLGDTSNDLYGIVAKQVQAAQIAHASVHGPNPFAITGMATGAALGALTLNAMVFSKRDPEVYNADKLRSGDKKETDAMAWALVKPETLVFASLIAAHACPEASADSITFAYGPEIFWEAVSDWGKIFPDKSIDDYIDPALVSAARRAGLNSEKPFAEFLKGRLLGSSSGSLN